MELDPLKILGSVPLNFAQISRAEATEDIGAISVPFVGLFYLPERDNHNLESEVACKNVNFVGFTSELS